MPSRSRIGWRWVLSSLGAAALLTHVAPALAEIQTQWAGRDDRVESVERDSLSRRSTTTQRGDWSLALEAVTNVPVDIGARVTLELPFRLRAATGLGFVPGAYLGLINDAVSGFGAYDDRTAGIVDGSFSGGTVWRTQVGFRPFPNEGIYVDAGYALVRLSGSVYGSDVVPNAQDLVIDGVAVKTAGYDVNTTLHMWLVEVGWQTRLVPRMTFGVALGVMGTLSATTDALANFEQGRSGSVASISRRATQDIDETLETYGYVPTLTLRLGYDFL